MTAQDLVTISNLIPLLAGPAQQAIKALLNQVGVVPSRLLEMAGHNNQTALTMIEAEINRVGASLPPSPDVVAKADELVESIAPKKSTTVTVKKTK